MNSWKFVLLAVVFVIIGLFALGLGNDPREIPSPLVGKKAADINAPALGGGPPVTLAEHQGKWIMVNFWGSWCVSCIAEHPHLMALAQATRDRKDFAIIGVDFKDTLEAGRRFLARHGDPGYRHAFDPDQHIAIDWGVYGAPESFIIDPQGIIRFKQAGPIYPGWFESKVLPLLEGKGP